MSLHICPRHGPRKPSSCATFTLNSQKSLASKHAVLPWYCPTLCEPVDCGLPGFSVREGGSPDKNIGVVLANIGVYWLILVAILF